MRNEIKSARKRKSDKAGRIKVRKNGKHAIDAQSTMRLPTSLAPNNLSRRITRPNQFNWLLPSVGAVTPILLESILRAALAGDHVQQAQLFDLMLDSWPGLRACVEELTYGVARREIIFDPFTEEDEKPSDTAVERTKLVSSAIRRMMPEVTEDENGLVNTVKDLMDGWFRGITVLEVLWDFFDETDGTTINAPRATAWVQPQQYGFNQFGVLGWNTMQLGVNTSVVGFPGPRQMQLEPFPPFKFLVGIHKSKSGIALGGPMLRPLAWWWCAANFASDWLLNLAQVFGLPFRWANYASATPDQTVSAICDMLANMGSAGWAAFPEGTKMELVQATREGGHSPQDALLDRADRFARELILGQTMSGQTMLTSGRGGQAFGTVEAQLKQDRLEAASDYVAAIFNQQLIPWILMRNFGDTSEAPICRFLQDQEGSYQDAQRDQILSNMGLPIPISHIRKKYSIPEPEGDEEVLKPIPKTPPGFPPGAPGAQPSDTPGVPAGSKVDKASQGQPVEQQQAERQAQLEARFRKISLISDEAVFGSELKKLAVELVTNEENKK